MGLRGPQIGTEASLIWVVWPFPTHPQASSTNSPSFYVISLLPPLCPTTFARVILFFTGVFGWLKALMLSFSCTQVLDFLVGGETSSGRGCFVGNGFGDFAHLELSLIYPILRVDMAKLSFESPKTRIAWHLMPWTI
uniref:Uncharacterized protein n=1 Tax=Fagus sylvatica TaxID=28930 RepID=A0A2N9I2I1_FAGSY